MGLSLRDPSLLKDRCLVGGAWIGVPEIDVTDPASGETIAAVPNFGAAETRKAVEAADGALPGWRGRTAAQRSAILRRWFEAITDAADDLAVILSSEQGKPLAEARGEIVYAASFIELFAEEGKRTYGEIIPSPRADARIVVIQQPVGMTAAITPWNFPAAMITRKAGPALAAGCTMVLKPAMQTPLTALALSVLAQRSGVPDGVLNVVTERAREIGGELTGRLIRPAALRSSRIVGRLER